MQPHVGLSVFLMALPLTAFVSVCWILLRIWRDDVKLRQAARDAVVLLGAHVAALLAALATLLAGGILAIVALHTLTD